KVVSQVDYKDLVNVHKDSKGKIVMVQPNTIMLNKIMSETVIEVSRCLGQMKGQEIQIPMGQVSGSKILA
ncbi:sporulation protein, partial [Clostridiales bacterium PH28_bin88]